MILLLKLARKVRHKKSTPERVVDTARTTNPAFPVAGAAGMTLIGAALMRRRRNKAQPAAH